MKIRTDFVTNSSTYCSAEIVIDNPVLLEILQKYKDLDLIYSANSGIYIGEIPPLPDYLKGALEKSTKTPAICYIRELDSVSIPCQVPQNLCEVISNIADFINDNDGINGGEEILAALCAELESKKEQINNSFIAVKWVYVNSTNEHDEDYVGRVESNYEFDFNRAKGEKYYYFAKSEYSDNDEIEDDEILHEHLEINRRKVKDLNRTLQVPNSISPSHMDIEIDNPVLFDILQQYKDKGLFKKNDIPIQMGTGGKNLKGLAFAAKYGEGQFSFMFAPQSLDEVLDCIIKIMDEEITRSTPADTDQKLFSQMKDEMHLQQQEIKDAYQRVDWDAAQPIVGREPKAGDECEWKFHYDPINGVSLDITLVRIKDE